MTEAARARLAELIRKHAMAPDANGTALVDAARQAAAERDFAAAVGFYRRALNLDYGRVQWRMELARALAELGRIEEAIDEARIAQRLGASSSAEKFILELRLRPASTNP